MRLHATMLPTAARRLQLSHLVWCNSQQLQRSFGVVVHAKQQPGRSPPGHPQATSTTLSGVNQILCCYPTPGVAQCLGHQRTCSLCGPAVAP
jgi:hypothetical protein